MTKFPIVIFNHEITNTTEADSWIGILKESIQMLEAAIRDSLTDPDLPRIVNMLNSLVDAGETILVHHQYGETHTGVTTVSPDDIYRFMISVKGDLTQGDKDASFSSRIVRAYKVNYEGPNELLYERKRSPGNDAVLAATKGDAALINVIETISNETGAPIARYVREARCGMNEDLLLSTARAVRHLIRYAYMGHNGPDKKEQLEIENNDVLEAFMSLGKAIEQAKRGQESRKLQRQEE